MWKFYFPTMIHAEHKSVQTLQTSLTCGKPNRLNFHKWEKKKNFVPMQEKKATSHMSLQQGELMIYFLSMFLKHQPRSYSRIKLQMSALKSWRESFFF